MKILFRQDRDNEAERIVASQYCDVVTQRTSVTEPHLVVGRYSVLPFYKELELDLASRGAYLIHSYQQHRYIATMGWADDLEGLTPPAYRDSNFYSAPEGAYVVKGETNSKKLQWDKKMLARTKSDASRIASDLIDDGGLLGQDIVYRPFVQLRTFDVAMNELPITNEWRFFMWNEDVLAHGYYWSEMAEPEVAAQAEIDEAGFDLVRRASKILSPQVTFYVLDIAQKHDGDWMVVEINDGQMSGLSGCDANALYRRLSEYGLGVVQ